MQTNVQSRPGSTRPRRLLLCLDGVPHELIKAARSRGLFDTFGAPTRLLSPFPTMTNVALSAMFSASPPAGYESLYFDRSARELRGGISKYLGRRTPDKMPSSYMNELDYQEPLAFEFLVYVAPEKVWPRTCNVSTNDFVPLHKPATTLLFSKAQTDCCTVVVRHDCQLPLKRSMASFVRSRTSAVGKQRSCFFQTMA